MPRTVVAIGDLQRTILVEQLYLGRRQNDAVRVALMEAIGRDHPDVLLALGDQVADGASDREWFYFDALLADLRASGTAVHAVRGNHDYSRFDRQRSDRNFHARFGWLRPGEPEVVRFGELAYVGLDSNFPQMGPALARHHAERYASILAELDADPSVHGVIVASHHPPYTNSRLLSPRMVIDLFAEPFLAARKTALYLSAHVHAYERFERDGKMFVVSGGGGGPRRRVDISEARRWRNDVYRGPAVRPFHYLRITPEPGLLRVEVPMLAEETGYFQRSWHGRTPSFAIGDAFEIRLALGTSMGDRG